MYTYRIAVATLLVSSTFVAVGCTHAADSVDSSEGAQKVGASAPAVGEYELDTDARSAVLKVKSADASSITFDLEAYNNFGAYNQGFVSDATARGSNGLYKHTSEDCELTFKVSATSIDVDQQGICGMGNNVYATGTFKPKAPEPAVASLCDTAHAEQVIFACNTRGKKIISICGYKGAAQYRYGTGKKIDMKLPAQMTPAFDKPSVAEGGFISLAGPGAGGAWATFHNGEYDYTVFTIDESKGIDDEGRSKGLENVSGVLVLQKGKTIGFVKCAAEPKSELPSEIIAESTKQFDTLAIP